MLNNFHMMFRFRYARFKVSGSPSRQGFNAMVSQEQCKVNWTDQVPKISLAGTVTSWPVWYIARELRIYTLQYIQHRITPHEVIGLNVRFNVKGSPSRKVFHAMVSPKQCQVNWTAGVQKVSIAVLTGMATISPYCLVYEAKPHQYVQISMVIFFYCICILS